MPAPRFDSRKQVLWAAAGGSEKAYRAFDIDPNIFEVDAIRNGVYFGDYQDEPEWPGGSKGIVKFKTELHGGANATTAIPENDLFSAAGFGVSVVSGVAEWTLGDPHPTTGDFTAADVKVNIDGLEHAVENCAFDLTMILEAGKFGILEWTGIGNTIDGFAGATEVAMSALTASGNPVPCEGYGLQLGPDGAVIASLVCNKATFAFGNMIDVRPDLNGDNGYSAPIIAKRNPLYTFEVETSALATVNWESIYLGRGLQTFSLTHNSGGATNQVLDISGSGYITEMPKRTVINNKVVDIITIRQASHTGLWTGQWS